LVTGCRAATAEPFCWAPWAALPAEAAGATARSASAAEVQSITQRPSVIQSALALNSSPANLDFVGASAAFPTWFWTNTTTCAFNNSAWLRTNAAFSGAAGLLARADLVHENRRATAYGVFAAIQGAAPCRCLVTKEVTESANLVCERRSLLAAEPHGLKPGRFAPGA